MELREAWAALRLGWWVCLTGLLVGAALTLAGSVTTTPLYTAQLQLFVSTPNTSVSATEALQGSQFSEQRVASYAQLITGDALARSVITELGLELTPAELADRITASGVTDTVLLDVSVSDASPERAQAIAQAIGELFPDQVDQLEESGSGGTSLVKVTVTQDAELPVTPSSPQTTRDVAVGAMAGLLVGAVVSVGWLGRRRAATRPAQLEEVSGAPVLASLPRAAGVDTFRRLALDVLPLRTLPASAGRLVVVTSTGPAGGGVARGLAAAFADTGRRVTLVDADLAGRLVTDHHGAGTAAGLVELLTGDAVLADVRRTTGAGYDLVPTGQAADRHHRLLVAPTLQDLVAELVVDRDVVVVDAAPLSPSADALGLVSCADTVLLAVVDGRTRTEELEQARRTLDQLDATVAGLVLVAPAGRRARRRARALAGTSSTSTPSPTPTPPPAAGSAPPRPTVWAGSTPPPPEHTVRVQASHAAPAGRSRRTWG